MKKEKRAKSLAESFANSNSKNSESSLFYFVFTFINNYYNEDNLIMKGNVSDLIKFPYISGVLHLQISITTSTPLLTVIKGAEIVYPHKNIKPSPDSDKDENSEEKKINVSPDMIAPYYQVNFGTIPSQTSLNKTVILSNLAPSVAHVFNLDLI
jgi:hypothetical protein